MKIYSPDGRVILEYQLRLGRGFKTDSEELSHLIRREFHLPTESRVNAFALARFLGFNVIVPSDTSLNREMVEELETKSKSKWSAAYLPIPGPTRDLIIHNPTHAPVRQESNIFHEIAHRLCGHEPKGIRLIEGLPIHDYDNTMEDQAHFLGYALHIPKDGLFSAVKEDLTNAAIGENYKASSQLVTQRLNATQVRKICARSKAKWQNNANTNYVK